MSWPIVDPKSHNPAAGFGFSSSLLYTPTSVPEEPVRVPNQTHPELRLFNLTNGYNAMPIIPPDTRTEYASSLGGPLPEDVFVPRTLATYMEHESRNVSVEGSGNTDNAVYDPAIGRLFDIGLIRDGLEGFEYMRHTRRPTPRSIFNVACYVTGQERTAVGLSLMTLMPARREFERVFRVDDYAHEYALPYLPSLRTFNLLRTDTPVKDVRLIKPTTDHQANIKFQTVMSAVEERDRQTGLLVRTESDITVHRMWVDHDTSLQMRFALSNRGLANGKLPMEDDGFEPSIVIDNSMRLPLKARNVMDCTASRNAANWLATVRSDGALTQYIHHEEGGRFVSIKCPPLHFEEVYSPWHRVREVDLPEVNVVQKHPSLLMVGNRKSLYLYASRANYYVGSILPRDMNLFTTTVRDFQPGAASTTYAHNTQLRPNDYANVRLMEHQYFVLTNREVQWLDLRNSRTPVLSVPHNMNPLDPSLQLDMSFAGNANDGLHIATVYSEADSLATTIEFGLDAVNNIDPATLLPSQTHPKASFEEVPVIKNLPQVFSTLPSRRTQTLRAFELPLGDMGNLLKEPDDRTSIMKVRWDQNWQHDLRANNTRPSMRAERPFTPRTATKRNPLVMGCFEFTKDYGLYLHVLGSDQTINLNLHGDADVHTGLARSVKAMRGPDEGVDRDRVQYFNAHAAYTHLVRDGFNRMHVPYEYNRRDDSHESLHDPGTAVRLKRLKLKGLPPFGVRTVFEMEALRDDGCQYVTSTDHLYGRAERIQRYEFILHKTGLHSLLDGTYLENAKQLLYHLYRLWMRPLINRNRRKPLRYSSSVGRIKRVRRKLWYYTGRPSMQKDRLGAREHIIKANHMGRGEARRAITRAQRKSTFALIWIRRRHASVRFTSMENYKRARDQNKSKLHNTFKQRRNFIIHRIMADIMKSCMVVEPDLAKGAMAPDDKLLGILDKFVVGGRGQGGALPELSADTREQLAQWDDVSPVHPPGYDHHLLYSQLKGLAVRRKNFSAAAANQGESEADGGILTQTHDEEDEEEEELTQRPLPYLSSSQPTMFIPPPMSSQPAFSLAPSSQPSSMPRSSQGGSRRKRRRVNEGF
jgi:hypothetical protein